MSLRQVIRTAALSSFVIILFLAIILPPAFSYEVEESNDFIEGFNAYQRKEYNTAIVILNKWLKDYPNSLNRDVTMFWLSLSYQMTGNQNEAASYTAQLTRDYPDSPLVKLNAVDPTNPAIRNEKEITPNSIPIPEIKP
jgi:hypothetical protein